MKIFLGILFSFVVGAMVTIITSFFPELEPSLRGYIVGTSVGITAAIAVTFPRV